MRPPAYTTPLSGPCRSPHLLQLAFGSGIWWVCGVFGLPQVKWVNIKLSRPITLVLSRSLVTSFVWKVPFETNLLSHPKILIDKASPPLRKSEEDPNSTPGCGAPAAAEALGRHIVLPKFLGGAHTSLGLAFLFQILWWRPTGLKWPGLKEVGISAGACTQSPGLTASNVPRTLPVQVLDEPPQLPPSVLGVRVR